MDLGGGILDLGGGILDLGGGVLDLGGGVSDLGGGAVASLPPMAVANDVEVEAGKYPGKKEK